MMTTTTHRLKLGLSGRPARSLCVALLSACLLAVSAAPLIAQQTGKPALKTEREAKGAEALTAKQIMDEMNARHSSWLGVTQGEATIELVIEDRAGTRRERALQVKSKKVKEVARTLITLTAPKELIGQSFLFSENASGEDDVWMYLPAFKVSRRVEGSQKRGAFLGSHFSFADLESRDLKEADYARQDDEVIAKDPVFVIQVTPRDPSASDYGQVIAYVRQSDYMPLKLRFYDKDKETVLKTLFVEKIETGDDGEPAIRQMTLHASKGGFSTIVIRDASSDTDLPDSLFTREQLGK